MEADGPLEVLVVVPAWNEEQNLGSVIEDLRGAGSWDIIVVDDGSSDRTGETANRAGADVLALPINLGIGGAVQTGYKYALDRGYDVVIQVELKVASDNTYTYLCFEDMKPAGCEPTQVTSGGKGQEGFYSYMELRDEKVVFFVRSLGQGAHLLRYRLRAEVPGVFHALPSVLYGMYVPELRANSNEHVIKIVD